MTGVSSMSVIRNVLIWDSTRKSAERGDIEISSDGRISGIVPVGSGAGELLFDGRGSTAVIPGLVNAHTHISMTLLRGLGEELPLMDWLQQRIFPVEDRMRARHIRGGAELGILEMISGGVTCFADMYFFMSEVADAVLESGVRAALCRGITGDSDEKIDENLKLASEYAGREGRIAVQLGPHAPYTVPMDAMKKIAGAAAENGLGIHFHWLETEGELKSFSGEYGMTPTEYLKRTGLLNVKELILAHSVWYPTEELHEAARDSITVVHNPKSNLKLGSGYAPVGEMLKQGVRVALGTDGAASNNRLDIWDEMRTAALMHKGYHRDPTLISAREVLRMATSDGAVGVGFKGVGEIAVGAMADVIAVDLDQPQYVGCDETNLPEFLVYAGSSRDVRATLVAGRLLYRDGEFKTLDRERIVARAKELRSEITG